MQSFMETTELRIDNLVSCDGETVKIVAINKITDTAFTHTLDEETMSEVPVSALQGIPLTPEWLERFGWKHINTLYSGMKVFSGKPYIYECETGFSMAGTSRIIKYVHDLQNYIFSVTGQDLQTK